MNLRFAACGLAVWLACCACAFFAQGESIHLQSKGSTWSVDIDPSTLRFASGEVVLSAPQDNLGEVQHLERSSTAASWTMTGGAIEVRCAMSDDELSVEFDGDGPASVGWPIVPGQSAIRAMLLPMFEGLYIPLDEDRWRRFLVSQGDLNTTGDLSMPFLGFQTTDSTFSYILADQFNNTLRFTDDNGSIATAIKHQFTPLDKVREYRVLIRRGSVSPVEPARQFRNWLVSQKQFVSMPEKIRQTPKAARLLGAIQGYLWGDGVSIEMLDALHASGIDRACLTLGDLDLADGKP